MSKTVFAFLGLTVGLFFLLTLFQMFLTGEGDVCLPSFSRIVQFYSASNPFNPVSFKWAGDFFRNLNEYVAMLEDFGNLDFFALVAKAMEMFLDFLVAVVAIVILPFETVGWLFGLIASLGSMSLECYVMPVPEVSSASVQFVAPPSTSPFGV